MTAPKTGTRRSLGRAVFDESNGAGVVDEILIGSADIDATTDALSSGYTAASAQACAIGPMRRVRVIGLTPGVLAYVDDITGRTRILNLAIGDEIGPIAIRTINGTSNATPSAALSLRVQW
jgi:hypothetical protein